jgi:hypothetical protein
MGAIRYSSNPENSEKWANFAILALKLDQRECLVDAVGQFCGHFLREAFRRFGFKKPVGQMQCDHKSKADRSQAHFRLTSKTPLVDSHNGVGTDPTDDR